jgi:fumarylacetoacetate (FAA) hydrolase family protein
MSIIGIVLGVIAIGLIFWFRKNQQKTNELVNIYFDNCETGMNAMMEDSNNYQVKTDRKIAELEKQLEIKSKSQDKRMDKMQKELPSVIGRVVGQIEFAQDKINRVK